MFIEICDFIAEKTGFKKGSSLQVGHRPATAPVRCVLIAEAGGGDPNPYSPDMAFLNIQAVSRSRTYFEARSDVWDVYRALHGTGGWDLKGAGSGPDYLIMTIDAITTPQYLGQDEEGRYEFSVNFIFRIEQASCGK